MTFIASLPMYDLPEERDTVDALWCRLRGALRHEGLPAPESLVRRNADMPAVPGGIRDYAGAVIAADPATLPPDELDLDTLWRHPALLLGEACWGPLDQGMKPYVHVVGQHRYDGVIGGNGHLYRSAIVVPRQSGEEVDVVPGAESAVDLPLGQMAGLRFAFNATASRSGYLALQRDLLAIGKALNLFSAAIPTGSHFASVRLVATGKADVAAIDCRSWELAKRYEPHAAMLRVIGWTAPSTGLPYICSAFLPDEVRRKVSAALDVTLGTKKNVNWSCGQ